MSKTVCLAAVAAAASVCFSPAAQKKSDAPKSSASSAMPAPKPAPEMKELTALVGTWSTEEKFEVTPFMPSGSSTGTNVVRLGPGGFTVIVDQRSQGSLGTFVGHGVMTWDPNDKVYRTVWSDSMSPGVMISTGLKQGDKIVYTADMTMMGKKMAFKDVISDRTPTSYILTSYVNDGSGEKKTMTIRYTRQESAATK
jgi:Protein of unknown function (DUF1579)